MAVEVQIKLYKTNTGLRNPIPIWQLVYLINKLSGSDRILQVFNKAYLTLESESKRVQIWIIDVNNCRQGTYGIPSQSSIQDYY